MRRAQGGVRAKSAGAGTNVGTPRLDVGHGKKSIRPRVVWPRPWMGGRAWGRRLHSTVTLFARLRG